MKNQSAFLFAYQRTITLTDALLLAIVRSTLLTIISALLITVTVSAYVDTNKVTYCLAASHNGLPQTSNARKIKLYKEILYTTNWQSSSRDSLKRYLEPIFKPICEEYSSYYNLPLNELTAVVMTMATSESGNSKGQPFSNTLFRQHNNPFGIKGKGAMKSTYEYHNGKRIDLIDEFAHFKTLEHSVHYLLGSLLMNDRYTELRCSNNYIEFFNNLYKSGYFTNPTWHKVYFIPTCRDYYL